ncbi:MAG: DNA polymerase III subunit gamma/tau [Chlorobi bacterium]|nr:DNA polymerase III subunit gamma/tau [Chlorobiota bacterium]
MDNYIVSALKYRPSTFNTVVGQSAITSTLKNAIKNNHLAHAYLFCGPRGIGKTTCARIFAKTINCENKTADSEACNECESCKAFNQDRSFNIHELDAASNSSVDNIRSLIDQVRIPPQIGKYSLYIIDEVHMLSASAFNAFLKTLEEPPAHAIFILATTEKHKIIPTILSRCQIFDFHRISISQIINHLQFVAEQENVTAEEEALNIIAQKADGSMRDALSIFDQIVSFAGSSISYKNVINSLNVLDYEYYFKLIDNFLESDYREVLLTYNEILSKGFDGHNFINGLANHLRDLLVCKNEKTLSLLDAGQKIKDKYKNQAQQCPVNFIFSALEICNKCDINYKLSKNFRLHVELALLNLSNLNAEKKKNNIRQNIEEKTEKKELKEDKQESEQKTNQEKIKTEIPEKKNGNLATQKSISVKEAFKLVNEKSEIIKEPEVKISKQEAPIIEEIISEFTIEQLLEKWSIYAKNHEEEKRLFTVLTSNKPVLTNNYAIEYRLKNTMQEIEIKDIKPQLLNFLKQELKNSSITLNFIVEEVKEDDTQKKHLFTDRDKYKFMSEKNPNLEKLRQQLNLDFE